jgi:hypothetical protein
MLLLLAKGVAAAESTPIALEIFISFDALMVFFGVLFYTARLTYDTP